MSTPATFKLKPQTKWIVGRIVDIDMSEGGIALSTSDIRNITVFLIVDAIGPDVKRAAVGEIIVYRSMNHVHTRDGQHVAVVLDDADNIIGKVEGLDLSRVVIEGEKKRREPAEQPHEEPRMGFVD